MSIPGTPLTVLDCRDPAWPPPNHEDVLAWARSEGIDPADTTRVEVRLLDTLFARVTEYVRDDAGRRQLNEDRTGILTRTRDLPVSSRPPIASGPARRDP